MPTAFTRANDLTDWRIWPKLKSLFSSGQRRQRSDESPWTNWVLVGIGVLVLVELYARHNELVAIIVVLAALVMLVTVLLTFTGLWWKETIDARQTAWRFIFTVLLVGIGLYDGVSLVHPAFNANAVADLLEHGPLNAEGTSFGTVLYQAFGACLALLVAVVSVFYCIASITAVYIAARAAGIPLWRLLYWTSRWTVPRRVGWVAMVCGVISIALTNGLLAHLLDSIPAST